MSEDIQALAARIRDRVDLHHSESVHPETRHLHDTAVAVAGALGMKPDALNVRHLMGILASHAKPAAYPKMKYHHKKRQTKTVESEREELALGPEWSDEHWSA
jgi:hypothetical protein